MKKELMMTFGLGIAGLAMAHEIPTFAADVFFKPSSADVSREQQANLQVLVQRARQILRTKNISGSVLGRADRNEPGIVDLKVLGDERARAVAHLIQLQEPSARLFLLKSQGDENLRGPSPDPHNSTVEVEFIGCDITGKP